MTGKAKPWSLVNSSGCPTARSGHCATVARDALYVFGGCGHPAAASSATAASVDAQLPAEALPICLGDLHVCDLARQRWSEVRPSTRAADSASEEPRPAERTCAAMCASEGEDAEDRLFLSGGAGDDPYDLRGCCWEFCVRRRAWRLLYEGGSAAPSAAPEMMSPCRRIGHTMVHDSTRNRLVIFGGSTGHEYFNDTQAFDLATGTWMALATTGERPSPRYKHQAFLDADFMYIVGGGSFEPEGPDLDVYRLPLTGGGGKALLEWERVRPTGTPPRCRAAHGLAWDRVGRAAYIWGGFTSGMELDSTFCALRLPPSAPPAPRAAQTTAAAAVAPTAIPPPVAVASCDAPLPGGGGGTAAAAAGVIAQPQDLVGSAEAVGRRNSSRAVDGRFRRTLSADAAGMVTAAGARENKPSGFRGGGLGRRASASATEFAEQQQWQHEERYRHHNQQQQQVPQAQQQQQQQQQQQLQQEALQESPPEAALARSPPERAGGRERWRRRGQRLWRQTSSVERAGGGNEGNASTPRLRGRGRLSWGQSWATGRLQGLWGGGGGGGAEDQEAAANRAPPPPAPVVALSLPRPPPELQAPVPSTATAAAAPAAVPVVGEKLSWVSLQSGQGCSADFATNAGEAGRATTSSPTGRSFHCAFFHGGACYVTGGSDGARKFGDMWRFCARETPPPLTTLAARAFVSGATARRNEGGRGSVGGAGGDGKCELVRLPGELREALQRLNMQAEVVL
ncbi:unnamed protein product [Ectocarpus sp. 4 AP-2014]